jgi:hypothetical protein
MDIKKYVRLKNNIETVAGIIIGFVFGAKFITLLFPFLVHYSSAGITISTSVYAPVIAIVTGVIIFFGVRTLAYLISSMFLGAGIGIALFELTGFELLPRLIEISHTMLILLI